MQPILVVDDDRVQLDVVSFLLQRNGLEPVGALDARNALRLFGERRPDLVILDINLGDTDGRDLLRTFRKQRPEVRILMLTALDAVDDRVQGLELGADDYLTKPFGHRELLARVRALLRRAPIPAHQPPVPRRMQVGSVVLDPATHEATRGSRRLDLSPTEFRLLQALMERPNVLVSTRTLLKEVWGHQDMSARNVLRVTASRLRAKLEDDPVGTRMLQTVPGSGLIIRPDEVRPTPTDAEQPVIAMDVVDELREIADDMGPHAMQELTDVFARTAEKDVVAMREALGAADSRKLAHDAHRLRGSSASLGAQRVSGVCASIEESARMGALAPVGDLLDQLGQELSLYRAAIAPTLR